MRKGRRDGHDSVALLSGKVPDSNGIQIGSIFAAVEGLDGQERCTRVTREITRDCVRLGKKFWVQHGRRGGGVQAALEAFLRRLKGLTGRSAGRRGVRAFTGDYERRGQKTFHASRQTGGWVKAAGVVAAGGAQAQRDVKRCMSSCDALLCILSVRAVSIKVARSVANCRVNSCVALLSLKRKFADGGSVTRRVRGRYGPATVVVLSDSIRLLRCRDGPLSPWFCGDGYSLYGGAGSCKGEGAGWALNCVLRKGRRDGHDSVVALAGSVPVSNGIDVRSILAAVEGVDRQARCRSVTREITRECVRLGKKLWGQDGRRVAGEGRRRGRGGRVQAGLEAFLRRLKGLHRHERAY